ncbi:Transmembrane protein [Mycobacterium sp. smrl_JER01]
MALTLGVTAPLLAPGYLLLRDAVSTPRSYLTDAALGLTEAAPRALPQDFAVALASALVDGGVVVKALLVLGLWLAGWGAARLVVLCLPDAGPTGQLVAVTVAIWNPYVAERLLQGHWSLLVGYGCLPWVAATVLSLRGAADGGRPDRTQGELGRVGALLFWVALAGLTPTGLMLAATVALAGALAPGTGRPRWWCAGASLAAAATAAVPWLVASAVAGGWAGAVDQRPGIEAFAARAEPGLGTFGSLAGLGGIWNAEAGPASRTTLFAVASTSVLLALVAVGATVLVRRRTAPPLLILAVVSVVVPALMATGPGLAAAEAVIGAVPGLGVVRDGQKWVALAMPPYALAGAGAVIALRPRLPSVATATVFCAALVATLPDLAWGVGGQVRSVQYPPGWQAAASIINARPAPVAVLPVDSMRRFRWAGTAPVLDPLPRWLRPDVLSTGDLLIAGQTVPGEGIRARAVQRLLVSGAGAEELAAAGVGWVVIENQAGPAPELGLPVAYSDDDLTVYDVGGDTAPSPHRPLLLAAHAVWLTQLGIGLLGLVLGRRRQTSTGRTRLPS